MRQNSIIFLKLWVIMVTSFLIRGGSARLFSRSLRVGNSIGTSRRGFAFQRTFRTNRRVNNDFHMPIIYSNNIYPRFLSGQALNVAAADGIFAEKDVEFESLGIQSPVLLKRLQQMALTRPTAVQAATFEVLSAGSSDVTVGAETGSGKTLAYLLPLVDDILQRKQNVGEDGYLGYQYARAMILVPNKELAQQVVRMALPLCGGEDAVVWGGQESISKTKEHSNREMVRIAIMPGGLKEPQDFPPFRKSVNEDSEPPVDIVISTPAAVGALGLSPKNINMFADIRTLVIDEADMLLDGGYLRPLENVLMGFRRADKLDAIHEVERTQKVLVAATLPDKGLRSVDAYVQKKFPYATRVTMSGMHNARHYGLSEKTVWIEEESKRGRIDRLVQLLQTPVEDGGIQNKKVMVFLNSVEDVEGATQALLRNEFQALPYHAKLKLPDRAANLDRFRRYNNDEDDAVGILVCTDLASRGMDIPGVEVVVQLQFAGNVVAHLHRMGRCGRAGHRTGRGIVFYTEKERELVEVVQEAENHQERMVLKGDVQEWKEDDDSDSQDKSTVADAFSRKRGFTKKRKKLLRESTKDVSST